MKKTLALLLALAMVFALCACGQSSAPAAATAAPAAPAAEAVPAFNKLKPFHPKRNQWVGYILTMNGIRYYVAGDTDALKELSSLRCDVALVPIGGTYTMTAKEAAGLINEMKPSAVIPTHYGSIVGKKEDADEFRSLVNEDIPVVTKL